MLRKIGFWMGVVLILGSYTWGLYGSLQHEPNTPIPVAGFVRAFTGLTLICWVVGGCLIAVSRPGKRTVAVPDPTAVTHRRRFPIATVVVMALLVVPAIQPLIWPNKTASPFGAFAEPVCLVAAMLEALCVMALVLRWRRKTEIPK